MPLTPEQQLSRIKKCVKALLELGLSVGGSYKSEPDSHISTLTIHRHHRRLKEYVIHGNYIQPKGIKGRRAVLDHFVEILYSKNNYWWALLWVKQNHIGEGKKYRDADDIPRREMRRLMEEFRSNEALSVFDLTHVPE